MANKSAVIFGKTDLPEDQVLRLTYDMIPTARKFHACDDRVRAIISCVGSGKSTMCVWELLFRAMRQTPNKYGIRESKWAIVRSTYPELLNTTMRTFLRFIPAKQYPNLGYSLSVNYSKPMIAKLMLRLPAGYNDYPKETTVEAEFIFLALDDEGDVGKLKSLDLTGAWINEAYQVDRFIFTTLHERLGRFPEKKDGVDKYWVGIIMDSNPPNVDHWLVDLFEREKPKGYTLYRQPPGILELPREDPMAPIEYVANMGQGTYPPAENIENLMEGYDYYTTKVVFATRDYIRVMLMGQYGNVSAGKLVYTEFRSEFHIAAEELQPYRGLPLIVGLDFGMTPACVMAQVTPRGQLMFIDELCCGLSEKELRDKRKLGRYHGDSGIRNFATNILKPYLANQYGGMDVVFVGDQAGSQRAQTNEVTVFEELTNCGINAIEARTNNSIARKEAIEGFMMKREGLKVSPRCLMLIEGFQKYYRYREVKKPDGVGYTTEPEKNIWSHVQDAAQYASMYVEDHGGSGGQPLYRPGSQNNYVREIEPSGHVYV